jgi:hypothetical protein
MNPSAQTLALQQITNARPGLAETAALLAVAVLADNDRQVTFQAVTDLLGDRPRAAVALDALCDDGLLVAIEGWDDSRFGDPTYGGPVYALPVGVLTVA